MTDQYAVIGNPIAHSKSPLIHAAFAREVGHDISYSRMLVPINQFRAAVDEFRHKGAFGANVTLPFKFEAFEYATQLTDRARASGAVNVLRFGRLDNGQISTEILGDNTDGIGLTRDITQNLGMALQGARILLIGAGGAAYGVAGALLDENPASLTITNRTYAKAQALATTLVTSTGKYFGSSLMAISVDKLSHQAFDVIINATSASMTDTSDNQASLVPATCFAQGSLAYDMMYGKAQTAFLQLAAQSGARTADGVGMLVEQAAEAFFVWRGVKVKTAPLISSLKQG